MSDKKEQAATPSEISRLIAEKLKALESASTVSRVAQLMHEHEEKRRSMLESLSAVRSLSDLAASRSEAITKEKGLLERIERLSSELNEAKKAKQKTETIVASLESTLAEYKVNEQINYLVGKVKKTAEDKIKKQSEFRDQFLPGKTHNTFVLSMDIRLSTDLMLNARTPDDFARYISGLCDKLTALVIDNGGVFDKFTGDGILAFFPEFYSGEDAGYKAVVTASDAIDIFREHYRECRNCFRVLTANTGLGIGIDYGQVHLVNIGEALSVVGTPVVYACRLSGTKAGTICVNQPAKEVIGEKYEAVTTTTEMNLDIKNSGAIYAYYIELKGKRQKLMPLPWEK